MSMIKIDKSRMRSGIAIVPMADCKARRDNDKATPMTYLNRAVHFEEEFQLRMV